MASAFKDATQKIVGRDYRTLRPVEITVSEGCIAAFNELPDDDHASTLPMLAPGLFDLQVNGAAGIDFNELGRGPSGGAARIASHLANHGVTSFLATFITNSEARLVSAIGALVDELDAAPSNVLASIVASRNSS